MNISYRDPDEAINEIIVNKIKVFIVKVVIAILIVIGIFIINDKSII